MPPGLPTIAGDSQVHAGEVYHLTLDPTLRGGLDFQVPQNVHVTTWHVNFGDGTPVVDVPGNVTDVTHVFLNAPNNLTITATATLNNHGDAVPAGTNVVAVEVHQNKVDSSDVVWGMKLRAYAGNNSPASIVNQPASQSVAEGQSFSWHADVAGGQRRGTRGARQRQRASR